MPHWDHGAGDKPEAPATFEELRPSREAMALFYLYAGSYALFVLLSAFAPQWMALRFGGLNLALWYGFGLVFGAPLVALVYSWLSRGRA